MFEDRPHLDNGGPMTVDAESAANIRLLGGEFIEQVALTREQEADLYRLYGYDPAKDKDDLARAGRFRNMTREARNDGLRILALVARFCTPGRDPLRLVRFALAQVGYDVSMEEGDDDV